MTRRKPTGDRATEAPHLSNHASRVPLVVLGRCRRGGRPVVFRRNEHRAVPMDGGCRRGGACAGRCDRDAGGISAGVAVSGGQHGGGVRPVVCFEEDNEFKPVTFKWMRVGVGSGVTGPIPNEVWQGRGTMGEAQPAGKDVAGRRHATPHAADRHGPARSDGQAASGPGDRGHGVSIAPSGDECHNYRSDPIARGRTDTRAWTPLRARARADAMSRRAKGSDTTASSARRRPWRCRKDIAARRWRAA